MNRVISVKPLNNFMLELIFADGPRKIVDIRPFISKGVSAALQDENYFRQVAIESGGGITWPNGYDFCPNFLHDEVPAVSVVTA